MSRTGASCCACAATRRAMTTRLHRGDPRHRRRARGGTGRTGHDRHRHAGLARAGQPARQGRSSTWVLGKPVEADLRAALGREIRVENDADCFAASEAVDGAGAGHNVVFAVILGSGRRGGDRRRRPRAPRAEQLRRRVGAQSRCPFPHVPRSRAALLLRQRRLHGDLGLGPRLRGRVRAPYRRRAQGDGDHRADARRRPAGGAALGALRRPRRARAVDGRQHARPRRPGHGRRHVERRRALRRPAAAARARHLLHRLRTRRS